MAAECEEGGLHLHPGNGYVEIVDEKTGRPVGDGQRGLVAVTAFRRGSRFLRYLIGDEAERVDEPCACGRATSRLRGIRRVLDVQRLRGGCASGGY